MLRICSGKEDIRMGFCDLGARFYCPLNPNIIVLKAAVHIHLCDFARVQASVAGKEPEDLLSC